MTRLTEHPDDTAPSASGSRIAFMSNRDGNWEVYLINIDGTGVKRLTNDSAHDGLPTWSPDGKSIALISRSGGDQVAILDLASRGLQTISTGSLNESPSYAPNGSMVVYAAGGGVLSVVAVDYDVQQRLAAQSGEVRDPAWSPFLIKRKP